MIYFVASRVWTNSQYNLSDIGNFRLIIYDKIHFKLEQKTPYKISRKFPIYILEISDLLYTTKHTLSCNKKRLQKKPKISYIYIYWTKYTLSYKTLTKSIGSFRIIYWTKYTLNWKKNAYKISLSYTISRKFALSKNWYYTTYPGNLKFPVYFDQLKRSSFLSPVTKIFSLALKTRIF